MEDKLHAAFDSVHAEAELKERTLAFLARAGEKAPLRTRPAARLRRTIAAVAACLLLLVGAGSYYAVLVPVSTISVDVNPSLELSLNRLDRVISVQGFNPEGEALASSLDVTFQPYTQALEEILSSETVSAYLAEDNAVSITVACDDPDKSAQMLSAAQACAQGCGQVYCHEGSSSDLEEAHHAGMSVGKYRAFLELQALDPSITAEEVQAMSMKEIRARIAALSSGETETSSDQESQSSSSSSGQQQAGSGASGGQQSGCSDGGNGQQSGSGSGGQNGHHGYGNGGHQGHE